MSNNIEKIDILLVTALIMEHDAAKNAAMVREGSKIGVSIWEERDKDAMVPYLLGKYLKEDGNYLNIALARPTRMGGISLGPLLGSLHEKLNPQCIAMCGVAAGNPKDLVLGDVIIAEIAYQYDEGKIKPDKFEGDHRQSGINEIWFRRAQDFNQKDLPSFSQPSEKDREIWFLNSLYDKKNPKDQLDRKRYFPNEEVWKKNLQKLSLEGLIEKTRKGYKLTSVGQKHIEEYNFESLDEPETLPFRVVCGPIASGNVVVKDGLTWDKLNTFGVRTIMGLEMEAAAVGSAAKKLGVDNWVVVKGVMDYADPNKNDRYKPFAARASAEVLFKFLRENFLGEKKNDQVRSVAKSSVKTIFVIGGETGESSFGSYEKNQLITTCINLGGEIAKSGADLIICSAFNDSADAYVAQGYIEAKLGGTIHFHLPSHEDVFTMIDEFKNMFEEHSTEIKIWKYPKYENDSSRSQAYLLCQILALEYSDIIIALGGRIDRSANTLLHLAERKRIPIVPMPFLMGAAQRVFSRIDWKNAYPNVDLTVIQGKNRIHKIGEFVNQMISDHVSIKDLSFTAAKNIFISRSSIDKEFGDRVREYLNSVGKNVLLGDEEIQNNRTVEASINEAIFKSELVIILWSRNYALSKYCYDEMEFAINQSKKGKLRILMYNLDGSIIVPSIARDIFSIITPTTDSLIQKIKEQLKIL